jgi:hypothetical protein
MPIFFERVKDEPEGLLRAEELTTLSTAKQLFDPKTETLKDVDTVIRLTKDLSSGKCVVRRYERFK